MARNRSRRCFDVRRPDAIQVVHPFDADLTIQQSA
jgi:hypothetical protein